MECVGGKKEPRVENHDSPSIMRHTSTMPPGSASSSSPATGKDITDLNRESFDEKYNDRAGYLKTTETIVRRLLSF